MLRPLCLIATLVLLPGGFLPVQCPTAATAQRQPLQNPAAKPVEARRIDAKHLPNPVQIGEKVISGGLPETEAAFEQLRALGVQTIISVDGAKPDVDMAARYGMRYVHLPHGYNGIPSGRVQELGKAVRDLDGPIYIHCHHGKHRSPAAASVACVAAGMIPAESAVDVLELAGTSQNYQGLYRSAAEARPIDPAELDALHVDFKPTIAPPAMVQQMLAIEHTHDNLQQIAAAGWSTPSDHPDLDPAHEALLMREHFTEMLRSLNGTPQPEAFLQSTRDSRDAAAGLESAIRMGLPKTTRTQFANRIQANCKSCHRQFRDIPLSN